MKNSSFESINTDILTNLLFVDISNTKIKEANFKNCIQLWKIILDTSQDVQTNSLVIREELTSLPVSAPDGKLDT